ncbi:MAG: NAD(+) kinase, partial [Segetibacter sp.]|nr:NAD(+) kinase [Segetibacter sp.]
MKVAIYSRGLDSEQEVLLLMLLEELTRNHVKISLHKSLLREESAVNILPIEFSVFSRHKDLDETVDC